MPEPDIRATFETLTLTELNDLETNLLIYIGKRTGTDNPMSKRLAEEAEKHLQICRLVLDDRKNKIGVYN